MRYFTWKLVLVSNILWMVVEIRLRFIIFFLNSYYFIIFYLFIFY